MPGVALGSFALRYAASDAGTGVASYDVRYRRAAWNAGFGALTYPGSWQRTAATAVGVAPARGSTYCLSVRARDHAGNVSGWSAERCTAAALDERSLIASAGWTQGSNTAYFAGTISRASSTGRTLTRTGVQAKRLYMLATTCAGCGNVGVYWDGHLSRQISLNSSATHNRQVIGITTFTSVSGGTLVIKTLNAGCVYVDGIAISRT